MITLRYMKESSEPGCVIKGTDLVQTRDEAEVQAIQVKVRRTGYKLLGLVEDDKGLWRAIFLCPQKPLVTTILRCHHCNIWLEPAEVYETCLDCDVVTCENSDCITAFFLAECLEELV